MDTYREPIYALGTVLCASYLFIGSHHPHNSVRVADWAHYTDVETEGQSHVMIYLRLHK